MSAQGRTATAATGHEQPLSVVPPDRQLEAESCLPIITVQPLLSIAEFGSAAVCRHGSGPYPVYLLDTEINDTIKILNKL